MMTRLHYIALPLAVLTFVGCDQRIMGSGGSSSNNVSGASSGYGNGGVVIEIDPTITAEQYRDALRRVKTIMVNQPFLTSEEFNTVNDFDSYKAAMEPYLVHPAAPTAIRNLFRQIYNFQGTQFIQDFNQNLFPTAPDVILDLDEPSNLAAYIYVNNRSYKEITTADYCVEATTTAEDYLNLSQADCEHVGPKGPNQIPDPNEWFRISVPMEMRAGAISTQANLRQNDGALNFRRVKRQYEYYHCVAYPEPNSEEPSPWALWSLGNPDPNAKLHPKYKNPESPTDPQCQDCHSGLNKGRSFFTGFDSRGAMQMGQTAPNYVPGGANITVTVRTINTVESATISGATYFSDYGIPPSNPAPLFEPIPQNYHGATVETVTYNPSNSNAVYPKLSIFGQVIAESPRFDSCTAQRLYNFAMGDNQNFLNRIPKESTAAAIKNALKSSGYNLKETLNFIFLSTDFLNQ